MYAMSYGTIPVVRSIGGLKDTVIDIDKEGYGFVHNEVTVDDIYNAVKRATHFYCNETEFKKVRKTIMLIDHSWDNSANAYVSLYKSLK
jgi:starch synthase